MWDRPLNMVVMVKRGCLRSDCECEQMSVKSLCSIFTRKRIRYLFCVHQHSIEYNSKVKVINSTGFQKTTEIRHDVLDGMT